MNQYFSDVLHDSAARLKTVAEMLRTDHACDHSDGKGHAATERST